MFIGENVVVLILDFEFIYIVVVDFHVIIYI